MHQNNWSFIHQNNGAWTGKEASALHAEVTRTTAASKTTHHIKCDDLRFANVTDVFAKNKQLTPKNQCRISNLHSRRWPQLSSVSSVSGRVSKKRSHLSSSAHFSSWPGTNMPVAYLNHIHIRGDWLAVNPSVPLHFASCATRRPCLQQLFTEVCWPWHSMHSWKAKTCG